jgi:iron uptake system EfeUOB component EfeO/EfeM
MSVQIEVNGSNYVLDGSRVLTEQEFQILAGYVEQHRTEVQSLLAKKDGFRALEKKVLASSASRHLSQDDLDELAELAEVEADNLLQSADSIQAEIDKVWSICPEVVTGGGYSLHQARWNS